VEEKKTMKKTACALLVFLAAFSGIFAQQKPRQGESSVTFMFRSGMTSAGGGGVGLFVDGKKAATMTGSTAKFIIPDGEHTIHAETSGKKSNAVKITAASHDLVFTINTGLLSVKIEKTKEEKLKDYQMEKSAVAAAPAAAPAPAAPPAPARRPLSADDIEDAIHKAGALFIRSLEKNSTVAIISVSARDEDLAEFIIDELAFVLVDSGQFKVVDRNSLDVIKNEQQFQISGEVDDNSAVSIGNMLGANIVITGTIGGTESARRLRMKALDVKTAEILAMASERY
jgi:TolB-like protein